MERKGRGEESEGEDGAGGEENGVGGARGEEGDGGGRRAASRSPQLGSLLQSLRAQSGSQGQSPGTAFL